MFAFALARMLATKRELLSDYQESCLQDENFMLFIVHGGELRQ